MRRWALCLLLATTLSCQAADPSAAEPAILSVTGEGLVAAAPDMASVTVGVTSQASDAASALKANSRSMTALMGILDTFNIEASDRRTSGFNISPRYERRGDDSRAPEITSYEVSNQVTIRYRDIDRLGDLLDAVVRAGGNRIHGLSFGNSDDAGLRDEARQLAVADARRRATLYAEAAGGELGRVLSITEAGAPQPRPEMRTLAMADAYAVPLAAGENEIRAVVNVVFELEQ
jgi:uncharacterized protein YggE